MKIQNFPSIQSAEKIRLSKHMPRANYGYRLATVNHPDFVSILDLWLSYNHAASL